MVNILTMAWCIYYLGDLNKIFKSKKDGEIRKKGTSLLDQSQHDAIRWRELQKT